MTSRGALVPIALAAALPLAACELVFGIDRFAYVDPDGGSAPDAETDAPAASDGPPDVTVTNGCPSGRGPEMVRIGDQCVDSTEVTEGQYREFLGVDAGPQPISCAWNKTFVPGEGLDPKPTCFPAGANAPQGCVDWCDAAMFCAWAGKHLCGAPSGATASFDRVDDPMQSAWFAACAGDAGTAYPYGDAYAPKACNGMDQGRGFVTPVASLAGCEGSAKGLFDMSGNVWEWEDACGQTDAAAGASKEPCRIRGGSVTDRQDLLRCDAKGSQVREFQQYNVGFRCCARAKP